MNQKIIDSCLIDVVEQLIDQAMLHEIEDETLGFHHHIESIDVQNYFEVIYYHIFFKAGIGLSKKGIYEDWIIGRQK